MRWTLKVKDLREELEETIYLSLTELRLLLILNAVLIPITTVMPLNELNEPNETHLEITDNEVNKDNEVNEADMLGQGKRKKKRSSWLKDFMSK
ncbi:hypothetical protein Tco_1506405 [Tanacetum coccineum]